MEKHGRCPSIPVSITQLNRNGITLRSMLEASPLVALPAIIGSFLLVIGFTQATTGLRILPAPSGFSIITSILLFVFTIWLRQGVYEITVDDTKQSIHGIPRVARTIEFREVTGISVSPDAGTDRYNVSLDLQNRDHLDLARSYPPELAMFLARHLSRMIARPLTHPRPLDALAQSPLQDSPPYRLPRAVFLFPLLVLAAVIASVLIIVFAVDRFQVFNYSIWPRLLLLAVVSFISFKLDRLLEQSGSERSRTPATTALLLIVVAATATFLFFPSSVFLYLTIAFLILHFGISESFFRHADRNRIRYTVAGLLAGLFFFVAIADAVRFTRFVNLDPGVIDYIIQIDSENIPVSQPTVFKIEKPSEVRGFMEGIINREVLYSLPGYESEPVYFRIVRRAGGTYRVRFVRYETPLRAGVMVDLIGSFPNSIAPLRFISRELDPFLNAVCKFTSIWPPRIKK